MSKYIDDSEEEGGDKSKKEKVCNEEDAKVKKFKNTIKEYLSKLVDHIDVNMAADAMSSDFMASRLPPFGHRPAEVTDEEKPPTLETEIKLRFPEHVRVVYVSEEDEDDNAADMSQLDDDDESDIEEGSEEDEKVAKEQKSPKKKATPAKRKSKGGDTEEEEEDEDATPSEEVPCIAIVHSLNNERDLHMTGSPDDMEPSSLKLPVHFARAATALLNSKDFVCVKDILLEDDDDKLRLATTLFADDLIEIKA